MSINQMIEFNDLQPADAVELVNRETRFPKHYAIYLGKVKGNPQFIANIANGVEVINHKALGDFAQKYEVVAIERFDGDMRARNQVIKKALSRLGEKAYNIIFNNCEHFKNWVLYGVSASKQVENTATAMFIGGTAFSLFGLALNKKGVLKAGLYILLILIVCIVVASYFYERGRNDSESNNDKTRCKDLSLT